MSEFRKALRLKDTKWIKPKFQNLDYTSVDGKDVYSPLNNYNKVYELSAKLVVRYSIPEQQAANSYYLEMARDKMERMLVEHIFGEFRSDLNEIMHIAAYSGDEELMKHVSNLHSKMFD